MPSISLFQPDPFIPANFLGYEFEYLFFIFLEIHAPNRDIYSTSVRMYSILAAFVSICDCHFFHIFESRA